MRQEMMESWNAVASAEPISTSLEIDNHTHTSSLNFYRPDALLDAQQTLSKL